MPSAGHSVAVEATRFPKMPGTWEKTCPQILTVDIFFQLAAKESTERPGEEPPNLGW